ncbi:hypothetical protein CMI37_16360 [Candidatus Pacearchaeota archaeon]|nr:hypothetical protein [Candidatus Pacearchaeota archaeon]
MKPDFPPTLKTFIKSHYSILMKKMVKVILTSHTKQRMFERAITINQIHETIELPDYIINKGEKKEAYKKINSRTLKVVYTQERKFIKIITVIWK